MHINSHNRFLLLTHFHCNTTQGHLRKFLVQDIDCSCLAHSTWRSWVIIISYMREILTWGAIIFWRSGNATIHSGKKKRTTDSNDWLCKFKKAHVTCHVQKQTLPTASERQQLCDHMSGSLWRLRWPEVTFNESRQVYNKGRIRASPQWNQSY